MSSSSYSKLTVPQLKALCKDRKLAGYSKLGKAALIQKLVEAESTQGSAGDAPAATSHPRDTLATVSVGSPVSNATDVVALVVAPPAISVDVPNEDNPTPAISMEHALATQKTTANDESTSTSASSSTICSSLQPPTNTPGCIPTGSSSSKNVLSSTSAKYSKRPMPPPHVPQSKRVKVQHPTTNRPRISGQPTRTNPTSGVPVATEGDRAQNTNTSETSSKGLLACGGSRVIPNTLGKPHSQDLLPPPRNISRFKPLVPSRNANIPGLSLTARNAIPGKVASSAVDLSSGTLLYLDPPPLCNPPSLKLITLPPPLSQRKRVQCWAIILRDLDDASRKQCVLVSRTIRYAVYLSAAHILKRRFCGTRLINDTKQYSRDMINFWPYLCFRLDEVEKRKCIYARSFLAQLSADKKIAAISEELWGSPESERQLTIALRFVLTRFWFALSLGGEGSEYWLGGVVLDAQQVVEGEIWRISMLHSGEPEDNVSDFYVLEATCEVIGLSSERSATSTSSNIDVDRRRRTACLRADWSSYVQRHVAGAAKPRSSILGSIKWTHFEEYERGISRLWLKRTAIEGELGTLKRTVAERYILACVVGNSVSGTQMTTTEMAQDFAGMPSRYGSSLIKRTPDLNLFLPAHHHVESIHFMTASKKPLHPALAIVQTPDREYFVLKDNGMEVGCEETGVAPVWMEVLKCSAQGTST